MSTFRAGGATEPRELVLGFGNLSDGEIERGIEAIGELLRDPGGGR
jgi:DNA-binding transcriptional MocR family regulator